MIDVGTAIGSLVMLWVANVATVPKVAMSLSVIGAHLRVMLKKQILWLGNDEDHEA